MGYILNLSSTFDIEAMQKGSIALSYKAFEFSGGEPHIELKISDYDVDREVLIVSRLNNASHLLLLCVAVSALHVAGFRKISALLPYIPGGRQDRITSRVEPFTLKVYADIINSLKFERVVSIAPHSDVTKALIENFIELPYDLFLQTALGSDILKDVKKEDIALVSPDAGASKWVIGLAIRNNIKSVIKADKIRDLTSGDILQHEVYAKELDPEKTYIVIDDLCDGGRTFIGLAEQLKNLGAKKLILMIAHGIFSKGFKELKEHYQHIITTDSIVTDYSLEIPEIEKGSEIVKVIKISTL